MKCPCFVNAVAGSTDKTSYTAWGLLQYKISIKTYYNRISRNLHSRSPIILKICAEYDRDIAGIPCSMQNLEMISQKKIKLYEILRNLNFRNFSGWVSYIAADPLYMIWPEMVNTLRQNGHHYTDDIFKYSFLNKNVWISIKILLMFVPWGRMTFQHRFKKWLGTHWATNHYLNQWWLVYWRIYASLDLNELTSENTYSCAHT